MDIYGIKTQRFYSTLPKDKWAKGPPYWSPILKAQTSLLYLSQFKIYIFKRAGEKITLGYVTNNYLGQQLGQLIEFKD